MMKPEPMPVERIVVEIAQQIIAVELTIICHVRNQYVDAASSFVQSNAERVLYGGGDNSREKAVRDDAIKAANRVFHRLKELGVTWPST